LSVRVREESESGQDCIRFETEDLAVKIQQLINSW